MPNYVIQKNPAENPVYPDANADHFIELNEGEFTGVHFNFGKIEFMGEDEDGNGKINFDYNLLFLPEHIKLEESKNAIEEELGKVLQHILENMAANNETGTSDTESTTEGRGLSEEGDTLPEG